MTKDLVTLKLDGAPEHRGHVMARALAEKLDHFLKTFAGFERAYLGKKTRQTDFEVVTLSHNSPSEIGLNPTPRVVNYVPEPAVVWAFDQWGKIARGESPDPRVDEDLIGDVARLCERPDPSSFTGFLVSYGRSQVVLDETAEKNARALRSARLRERGALPWSKGMSLGTLTGELRSVIDTHNERQIVICPPIGPSTVQCIFPESLRDKVRDNLFKFVRVHGLLHYTSSSPFPTLIELEDIDLLDETVERPHLINGAGLFRDSVYSEQFADL